MIPWNLTTFMLVSLGKCSRSGCQNSLLPFQDCSIAEPSKGGLFSLLQCPYSEWTRGGGGWGERSGVHVLCGQSLERCVEGFQLVVTNRKRRAPCTASGRGSMPVLVGRQPSLRREASTGCAFQKRRRRRGGLRQHLRWQFRSSRQALPGKLGSRCLLLCSECLSLARWSWLIGGLPDELFPLPRGQFVSQKKVFLFYECQL